MPSWSSLECSPACHAGDRGSKSRRGRWMTRRGKRPSQELAVRRSREAGMARYANRQSGQASNLGDCGFDSRLRHLKPCVGWATVSPTACKAAASGCAGSTPARRTAKHGLFVYRLRTPAPHAGKAGSIPARAAEHDQVAQLVDARRSERRAVRLGSSNLPLVTDTCRRGRCPTGSHKAGAPGSIPGPATAGGPVLSRAP